MDLKELREVFRARMKEEDFCIGEEQVEKLFRELLGEPEPVREYNLDPNAPRYSGGIKASEILEQAIKNINIDDIFNRDSNFYARIKK